MARREAASLRPVYVTAGLLSVAAAAYAAAGVEPSAPNEAVMRLAPMLAAAAWLRRDARAHGVWLPFDWPFLAFAYWPLLLPWYARRTRPGGSAALARLVGALLAPPLVGAIVGSLVSPPPR